MVLLGQLGFWWSSWKWQSLRSFSSKGFTLLVWSPTPFSFYSLFLFNRLIAKIINSVGFIFFRKTVVVVFWVLNWFCFVATFFFFFLKVLLKEEGIWIWWFRGLFTQSLEIIYILLFGVFFLLLKRLVFAVVFFYFLFWACNCNQ